MFAFFDNTVGYINLWGIFLRNRPKYDITRRGLFNVIHWEKAVVVDMLSPIVKPPAHYLQTNALAESWCHSTVRQWAAVGSQ